MWLLLKVKEINPMSNILDYEYKVVEHITKFLLSDLGIKKTYRDLKVFAYKTHMDETDKEEFEHLVNKYDLELETDFPNWLMCYYRETLLTIMRDLINNISAVIYHCKLFFCYI